MADVLEHFAVFSWLRPLALALALLAYYVLADGAASALRAWLPSLATVLFLAQAATIRRPGPNRNFRLFWAAAVLLVLIGVELTSAYAAGRMGQPQADHAMQVPVPGFGTGPSVDFDAYAAAVEAAAARSADRTP